MGLLRVWEDSVRVTSTWSYSGGNVNNNEEKKFDINGDNNNGDDDDDDIARPIPPTLLNHTPQSPPQLSLKNEKALLLVGPIVGAPYVLKSVLTDTEVSNQMLSSLRIKRNSMKGLLLAKRNSMKGIWDMKENEKMNDENENTKNINNIKNKSKINVHKLDDNSGKENDKDGEKGAIGQKIENDGDERDNDGEKRGQDEDKEDKEEQREVMYVPVLLEVDRTCLVIVHVTSWIPDGEKYYTSSSSN